VKVLLDTNIILDALQERQTFDAAAKEIMRHAQNGLVTALFTANTATDIFYLYSKARGAASARSVLGLLFSQYRVVDVTHDDCASALQLANDDFEDALLSVCAAKVKADYIVSRDDAFLTADSPVKVISPSEFLSKLG
jgi:predicted nucleic acid-binding protein